MKIFDNLDLKELAVVCKKVPAKYWGEYVILYNDTFMVAEKVDKFFIMSAPFIKVTTPKLGKTYLKPKDNVGYVYREDFLKGYDLTFYKINGIYRLDYLNKLDLRFYFDYNVYCEIRDYFEPICKKSIRSNRQCKHQFHVDVRRL